MNKNNHGGFRSNAGAKKKGNLKKIPVQTYHRECDVEKIGGIEVARNIAHVAIEKIIKKT